MHKEFSQQEELLSEIRRVFNFLIGMFDRISENPNARPIFAALAHDLTHGHSRLRKLTVLDGANRATTVAALNRSKSVCDQIGLAFAASEVTDLLAKLTKLESVDA